MLRIMPFAIVSPPIQPALSYRRHREVNSRVLSEVARRRRDVPPPNRAGRDQDQPDYENSGKNEEEDEPDIRVNRSTAHDIEQPKTDQRGCRTRCQNGSRHGQRIPAKVRGKTETGGDPVKKEFHGRRRKRPLGRKKMARLFPPFGSNARARAATSRCPRSALSLLLFQRTDVADELLDLVVRELALVGRHFAFAICGDVGQFGIALLLHVVRA